MTPPRGLYSHHCKQTNARRINRLRPQISGGHHSKTPTLSLFLKIQPSSRSKQFNVFQARCVSDVKAGTDHTSSVVSEMKTRFSSGGTEFIREGLFAHPEEI